MFPSSVVIHSPSCAAFEPRLHELVDGVVTDADERELRAHLAACAPCRARCEALVGLVARLGRVRPAAAPRELRARLMALLDDAEGRAR